jgi:hypothetical protein
MNMKEQMAGLFLTCMGLDVRAGLTLQQSRLIKGSQLARPRPSVAAFPPARRGVSGM